MLYEPWHIFTVRVSEISEISIYFRLNKLFYLLSITEFLYHESQSITYKITCILKNLLYQNEL